MSGDIFSYAFTPVALDVGEHKWRISAKVYVDGYIFASSKSISLIINVVECLILPPASYTAAYTWNLGVAS